MKKWIITLLSICILVLPKTVHAQEEKFYKADYDVIHTLQTDNSIDTKLIISFTNLRSDVYVTQFSLTTPFSSRISNLKALSPSGKVTTSERQTESGLEITFEFETPTQGREASNLLEIQFNQQGLVQHDGKTLEALLPTFTTGDHPSRVTFDTVSLTDEPLSISKPRPTRNEKTVLYWDAVRQPMVYVVFGKYQLYQTRLTYTLLKL